jgi:cellulose biosynthesis protein BcsQ
VGKTTLAINIASYISTFHQKRVLFLDADPQANSTQMIIQDDKWDLFYGEKPELTTIMEYFKNIIDGDSSVNFETNAILSKTENRFGIDLIPGHPSLSFVEDILSGAWDKSLSGDKGGFRKTNWLKSLTDNYQSNYDYLIIDVGPSLGAINRSILLNSDFVITPMGSDVFSLLGIYNISSWIGTWVSKYSHSINLLKEFNASDESYSKYSLNLDPNETTRYIGFSIQQYITKSFKDGKRPIASFERIIKEIPSSIEQYLTPLFYNGLTIEDLNLGDVPYLYSLVPLAQTHNAPMYNLTYADGVVGNQASSVKMYNALLKSITKRILMNIGDSYVD